MSNPLAAISVATKIRTFLLLKFSKALVRAPWLLLPCIATALSFSDNNIFVNLSAPCLVRQKTRTGSQPFLCTKSTRRFGFCFLSTEYNHCFTVSAVLFRGVTDISIGFLTIVLANFLTSSEKVAENIRFCRSAGNF